MTACKAYDIFMRYVVDVVKIDVNTVYDGFEPIATFWVVIMLI